MNINGFLQGMDCACGRRHTCDIDLVYIEKNAARHLPDICKEHSTVLIVADENTFAAAGEPVTGALEGKTLMCVIFPGNEVLIPDEAAIARVLEALGSATMIVGIGSGVIQDLSKYVSHTTGIPYIIFATAPSMDGYASDGAAMILGGMKETVKATLPRAILADTEVLRNAPMEMIVAGYGDIVGKYSALNDWRLAALINGEYLCESIYDITAQMIEKTLSVRHGLLVRDGESVRVLMEALIVVGIMMRFAGSSRPASGSEHHLSHFFEIVGIVKGEPYFPHGIDVAYSTVITARIREALARSTFPDTVYREDAQSLSRKMDEIYGVVGQSCVALQKKVGSYTAERLSLYKKHEESIKALLRDTKSPAEIEALLSDVGLEMQGFFDLYGREKIETAIRYAKDLKDRYTVLWLFYDLHGTPEAL